MQTVSDTYKQEIDKYVRNRGHIRVTIGVINQTAQANATVLNSQNDITYYSLPKADASFTDSYGIKEYATDELDYSRVDGTMYFLPSPSDNMEYYQCGIISNNMSILITFNGAVDLDIKGLTIDFGDRYPTEFTVRTNTTEQTYQNDSRYFSTEDVFDGTSYFLITANSMSYENNRFRILEMTCGICNTFMDANVENFTNKEYVSPVTDSVPSRDMTITINNRDQYYSPDNPDSAIAYMEVGQRVTVQFGYDLDDTGSVVEWIHEIVSFLSEWSATDSTATFTATDKFNALTGTYYGGLYRQSGISLYDLAADVLLDAGVSSREYFLDSYLKNVIVYNPLPPVSHAAALQIIANAGRCVLFEDRSGKIFIRSSFMPDLYISSNGEPVYSHSANLIESEPKPAYAIDSYNFTPVDGSVFFMADDGDYKENGYISNSVYLVDGVTMGQPLPSGAANVLLMMEGGTHEIVGTWSDGEPVLTVQLEAEYSTYGFSIEFREQFATQFRVQTFLGGSIVDEEVYDNEALYFSTQDVYMNFDRMVITFLRGYANGKVTVDSITFGSSTDYLIKRTKMTNSPIAIRQRRVKDIRVARDVYSQSSESIELSHETITVSAENPVHYIYLNASCFGYTVSVATSGVTAAIVDSSSYYVKLRFTGITGEKQVEYTLSGYQYTVSETFVTRNYHYDGEEIVWANPLVSSATHADDLAEWLSSFYLGDVQYDVTWVGDPRLDANDLIFLELKNRDSTLVRVYQNELSYNGAWSGHLQARKVVLDGTED